MRKPRARAAAAAAVTLATAACGTGHVVSGPPLAGHPVNRVSDVSPRPYDTADLRFGLDLLGAWCQSSPQIAFDRPYLMLVTEAENGEPLFLARVADPAG